VAIFDSAIEDNRPSRRILGHILAHEKIRLNVNAALFMSAPRQRLSSRITITSVAGFAGMNWNPGQDHKFHFFV
jgi:hypothetical protein